MTIQEQFGAIDIYLFDQLLRGRLRPGLRVLDAGCGGGRNLVYLLREGFDVWASDASDEAVAEVRRGAARLAPRLPASRFVVEPIESSRFADQAFDFVICNAVLHFADDEAHFDRMVAGLWRVLAPGGVLFARLASTIGLEQRVVPLGGGRHLLPDGSERFLVDEARLRRAAAHLGATQLDPLKTTIVQDQRAMTTWVLGKAS
jgi:tellurite methyltransferase